MAQPSQVFPPWLTAVPTTIVDVNGVPIATSTQVLYLPLTYYGPSIPLGPDWTYGGLTSPASTPTTSATTTTTEFSATTSSEIPLTTSTATPTTLNPTSSSSSSSSSLATPTTSSLSLSTSIPNAPSPSSSAQAVAASHHLSRKELIGVIVGTLLGVLLLFALALCVFLRLKARRREREYLPTFDNPDDEKSDRRRRRTGLRFNSGEGFNWVDRVPRHSGGEADPFLAQTTDEPSHTAGAHMTQHANMPPSVGIARVPAPNGSQSSKGSSSTGNTSATNHSGYGVLMERPTLNLLPSTQEELARQRTGHILTPEELDRINEESVLPRDSTLPPPRLLDPNPNRDSSSSLPSILRFPKPDSSTSIAAYPDADEAATLLTARRVQVTELASRSPPQLVGSFGEDSSKSGNRGLLSSLGLDRLSWFKNYDSGSRRSSRANGYSTSPLAGEDAEMGQALLASEAGELPRRSELGLYHHPSDRDRPISSSSTSGNTVYLDARSTPGTPISARTPIAPLPRALTPSTSAQLPGRMSASVIPPVPSLPNMKHSSSASIINFNHGLPVGFDVLDTPAPSALSPFTSSITTSESSMGDTTMIETPEDTVGHSFPPGLGLGITPQKSWTDAESSSITQVNLPVKGFGNSPASVNVMTMSPPLPLLTTQETPAGISIDLLEEAPPSAGDAWRNMAVEQGFVGVPRRTTFGLPVNDPRSDQVSLYSTNSHLAPASPTHTRSTGSDPNSTRRDLSGSMSSASSRPSAISAVHSHGSGSGQFVYSRSISSDRRDRVSPAMSAFGSQQQLESRSRSPHPQPPPVPSLNVPPAAHYLPERAGTHRMSGSQDVDAERGAMSEPEPMSPLSQMSSAPWAMGLSDNWSPTP